MHSSAEEEVIALSQQKWEWMSAGNVEPLESLFHEDSVFVHMGATFTKEQELDVIRTGRIHYRHVDISDVSIRIIGSAAIVLTTMQLGSVVNGNEVSNPFVVTETFINGPDGWTLGSMSFTRLLTS